MGYTVGRRLDFQTISRIAAGFSTRSAFQRADPSAYATARRLGILDAVASHMRTVAFSIPQLIMRDILDGVLKERSFYNSRKVIPPYEIDIYYPSLNLACEYNGRGWHSCESVKDRDCKKQKLLNSKGVFVLYVHERSRNYEEDIKLQLCENESFLKRFSISCETINEYRVNYQKVWRATTFDSRIEDIKLKVGACESISQFMKLFPQDYSFLQKNKLLRLTDKLPRKNRRLTDAQLIREAKTFESHGEFVKSGLYIIARRRGLLELCRAQMKRRRSWADYTDEQLLLKCRELEVCYMCDLFKADKSLFWEMKRRKLTISKVRKRKWSKQSAETAYELLKTKMSNSEIKHKHADVYIAYRRYSKK